MFFMLHGTLAFCMQSRKGGQGTFVGTSSWEYKMWTTLLYVAAFTMLIWLVWNCVLGPVQDADQMTNEKMKPRRNLIAKVNNDTETPNRFIDEVNDNNPLLLQKRRRARLVKVRRVLFPPKGHSDGEFELSESLLEEMAGYSLEQKIRLAQKKGNVRRELFPSTSSSDEEMESQN